MSETEQRILNKVRTLFFKRGFSKVTMDELAAELGMSKKTLYNYYSGKDEMLNAVIRHLKAELTDGVDRIMMDDDLVFAEKLASILSFISKTLAHLEAPFLMDIRKMKPELSAELDSYKRDAAFRRFNTLLNEGIRKGHVRKDINKSKAVLLYASVIEMAVTPEYLNQIPDEVKQDLPYQTADIYKGMVQVMLKGILTNKE